MSTKQFERRDARSSFKKLNLFVQEEIPEIEKEINGLYESNRKKDLEITNLREHEEFLLNEISELSTSDPILRISTYDFCIIFFIGSFVGGLFVYAIS